MLEQTLVSFIAEGWPSSQIVVVDNTDHARTNAAGVTPPQEHSSLNYTRIRRELNVGIYALSVRLTFAQVQNQLLDLAETGGIEDFYWAHQDIIVRSDVYPSFYTGVLAEQAHLAGMRAEREAHVVWAFVFFDHDKLSHVNVLTARRTGGLDPFIPYYWSDCDYCRRARQAGASIFDFYAGPVLDVGECLPNTRHLYASSDSSEAAELRQTLQKMVNTKQKSRNRNFWQGRAEHGTVSQDFGPGFDILSKAGEKWFKEK